MSTLPPPYSCLVGIDPGLTGYVTVFNPDGTFRSWHKTPITVDRKTVTKRATGKVKTTEKKNLDGDAIRQLLEGVTNDPRTAVVVIERQHAMAKQGLASTAKTMFGYGLLVGLAKGLGFRVEIIGAKEWQKMLLPPKSKDTKAESIKSVKAWNKEINLLPTKRSRKEDHNLADALNIGRYGCRRFLVPSGEAHGG